MNLVLGIYYVISLVFYPSTPEVVQLFNSEAQEFTLTAYTSGYESTGKRPGDKFYGITFSGVPVEKNVTIAVDPSVIPLGSKVYIEGLGYRVAQDTGSAIKGEMIDVYMEKVSTALEFGKQKRKVYVIDDSQGFRLDQFYANTKNVLSYLLQKNK